MKTTEKIKSGFIALLKNLPTYLLTILMFSLMAILLLSGAELIGAIELPDKVPTYLGAALIGYTVVGGIVVTNYCVKFLINKKG